MINFDGAVLHVLGVLEHIAIKSLHGAFFEAKAFVLSDQRFIEAKRNKKVVVAALRHLVLLGLPFFILALGTAFLESNTYTNVASWHIEVAVFVGFVFSTVNVQFFGDLAAVLFYELSLIH